MPGYPFTEDINGYQQEGVGKMDATVHQGERWSAASAYLRPILSRNVKNVYLVSIWHKRFIFLELENIESGNGYQSSL